MIAGFRNGEVDIATDLQDSDMPKVQDLGDQVSAIPSLTYEFLRPNWSDTATSTRTQGVGGCSKNPAVADRGHGLPDGRPGDARGRRLRRRQERDQHPAPRRPRPGREHVRLARRVVLRRPAADDATTPRRRKQILEDAGWKDTDGDGIREKDGSKAKIELCTTTRQVRQDTLALVAGWLKDVGIDTVINPVDAGQHLRRLQRVHRRHPVRPVARQLRPRRARVHALDRPARQLLQLPQQPVRPDRRQQRQRQRPDIDTALDTVKNSVDFKVILDAMADFQRVYVEKTVEIPLYYRKQVDLHAPRLGNFFANPTQAGPTWNVVDWFVNE